MNFTKGILRPNFVLGLDGAANVAMKVVPFWARNACGAWGIAYVIIATNAANKTTQLVGCRVADS